MNKRQLILFCAALLAGITMTAAALQQEQQTMAEKLIRLHVTAHSDTDHDQAVKLRVRDAVLEVTDGLSREQLAESLPQIRAAARDCLRALGESHPVEVTLGYEHFPTRLYDSFSLPAGVYETLRVQIGDGAGHNWWCVAFPSLCLRASMEEMQEAAVSAGFQQEELKLITEDGGKYILKFKLLEVLDGFKERFF